MKHILFILGIFIAAPAWAMSVDLTCFAKFYQCLTGPNGYTCQWQTYGNAYQKTVDLDRDPNYPTADFPYQVFRGRYQAAVDKHTLTLDLFWSDHDNVHPMKVYANLNAQTVMAESTGIDQIDIALRNQNYGRGFICTNFKLNP